MSEATALERALILCDDLATLKPEERIAYYKAVCESAGLNPATKPLNFLTLDGKLVLYAGREATDQLRKLHSISVVELAKELDALDAEKLLHVTVKISDKTGRTDISTGAVSVTGLKGDALGNAYMKAETKAKRRATLSICGLGMLDESELDGISPLAKLIPPAEQNVVVPAATVAPAVNQTPGFTQLVNVRPDPAHETTRFPAPPPVTVPPPAPKPAPAPISPPPVPQVPPAISPAPVPTPAPAPAIPAAPVPPPPPVTPAPAPVAPAVQAAPVPASVPNSGTVVPNSATPPPVNAAPVTDACTSEEYQVFVGQRAAKLVRDKLTPAGLKQAGDIMKSYLLKQSGKAQLKQISKATFEQLLSVLEAATPEAAITLVKDGSK